MQTIHGTLEGGTTSPSPSIACWLPEGAHSDIGIIIFPGGGYGGLAEHEGEGYARRLCDAGIASFVVTYRLGPQGHRHPAMLEDALAALETVRSRSREFGVDPHKIGVMGSSAGGHLAAHALVGWPEYCSDRFLRPDFGILCYPVIASEGEFSHEGSMRNLAGESPAQELLGSLSCDKRVTSETPPCFLWHTGEDTGVPLENSIMFARALRRCGVPFELHLYQKGGHGLGLGAPFDWSADCLRWVEELLAPSVPLKR